MAISKLILNGEVQMDVTSDTVEANKLLSGETATKNDGTKVTGTYVAQNPVISSLSVTPTESAQTFNAAGVSGYKPVTVGAIASNYVGSAIPRMSSANMTQQDIYVYASAGYYSTSARYELPEYTHLDPSITFYSNSGYIYAKHDAYDAIMNDGLITGNAFTQSVYQLPTLSAQTYTPGSTTQIISSYQWLTGSQTIAAIASDYVGSAIPLKSSTDIQNFGGGTIGIPKGYYSKQAEYTMPQADVSYYAIFYSDSGYISYGFSVSQGNEGYVFGGEGGGRKLPTLSAQTITPTESVQYISSYQWLTGPQTIEAIPSSYVIPSGTYSVTENGTYDIGSYASVDVSVAGGGGSWPIDQCIWYSQVTAKSYAYFSSMSSYFSVGDNIAIAGFSGPYSAGYNKASDFYSANFIWDGWSSDQYVPILGADGMSLRIHSGYITFTLSDRPDSFAFYMSVYDRHYGDLSEAIANNCIYGDYIDSSIRTIRTAMFMSAAFLTGASCDNVVRIQDYAFSYCSSVLTYISFPKCDIIESNAFNRCSKLSSVYLPVVRSIGVQAFTSCSSYRNVDLPKCEIIWSSAFHSCHITSLTLPECSTIYDHAFARNTYLSSLYLPACTNIGSYAFGSCTGLTNVDLPVCTMIYDGCFISDNKITTVNIPECTKISASAFAYCSSLATVTGSKINIIESNAFYSCLALTSITLDNCGAIGSSAFRYCKSLTSVTLTNCKTLGSYAFTNGGISELDLPALTSMDPNALYLCSSLRVVSLGSSCSSIPNYAFGSCTNLISLYLYASSVVTLASTSALYYTPLYNYSTVAGQWGSIYVPASLYNDYLTASVWSTDAISSKITSM